MTGLHPRERLLTTCAAGGQTISELETGHWVHAEQCVTFLIPSSPIPRRSDLPSQSRNRPRPFMRMIGEFVKANK